MVAKEIAHYILLLYVHVSTVPIYSGVWMSMADVLTVVYASFLAIFLLGWPSCAQQALTQCCGWWYTVSPLLIWRVPSANREVLNWQPCTEIVCVMFHTVYAFECKHVRTALSHCFYQHKLFIWDLAKNCRWRLFSVAIKRGFSAQTTMSIQWTHYYKAREGVWTWLDEPVFDECVQGNRLTQVSWGRSLDSHWLQKHLWSNLDIRGGHGWQNWSIW